MEGSRKAVFAALAANVGIATAKLVGWLFTGSASLLAETFHSIADTADQFLLLFGRWRSRRRETPEHPFGFGGERYFWAFIVSILLFTLGALAALYQGITGLAAEGPVDHPGWGFAILVVALVFDSLSLRTAAREANREREGSWWSYVRDTKQPEVTVILVEDSGAVAGVLVAMVALGLTWATGNSTWDALGSIGVGLVLAAMASVLAREMKSLLIGESASPEQEALIEHRIQDDDEVQELVYVRTMHLGPESILVEAKVILDPSLSVRDVALCIDRLEDAIRDIVPEARIISIEPDVPRSGEDPDVPVWADDPDRG